MAFPCPYCQSLVKSKQEKPGKYRLKCPKCTKVFQFSISNDSSVPILAEPINEKTPDSKKSVADFPEKISQSPKKPVKPSAPPPPSKDELPNENTMAFEGDIPISNPLEPDGTIVQGHTPPEEDPAANVDFEVKAEVPEHSEENPEKESETPAEEEKPAQKKGKAVLTQVPEVLGGYRIVKELGRGGMGAVYLAQQISLDRRVALKVMHKNWGADPAYVSRFTREAYAAAQLTHHNITQIYDFGNQKNIHYFSMEFVDGDSLDALVKKQGKIDPEQAIGYILQAARGLKYAHDRGMIHRDIKPANLMLNQQGILKVADLGLVKTPGLEEEPIPFLSKKKTPRTKISEEATTQVTRVGTAMGTPAFMSPEQFKDATKVDSRADIYSLGCTLYVLLTGRPPYEGKTVMEIYSKHLNAPLVPPANLVKRVPKELTGIIEKMVAKKPEDRFAHMGELIKVLENWLGQKSETNTKNLTENQVSRLEQSVNKFNSVKLAKFRPLARLGILGGCLAFAFLFLLMGWLKFTFGMLALAGETLLASFVVSGLVKPSPLFSRAREYFLSWDWKIYLKAAGGFLLALLILYLFNLFWIWLLVTLLAAGGGWALYFYLDRKVEEKRAPALKAAEDLLKKFRVQGMEEEALRNFVCKYGGNQWEEFYETLFGYEEKLKARDWWVRGQQGQVRQKFHAWRDPMIAYLDQWLQIRKEEMERRKLQKLEEERLKAEGMDAADARAKSEKAAERMVGVAAEIRQEAKDPYSVVEIEGDAPPPKNLAATMMVDYETVEEEAPSRKGPDWANIFSKAFHFVLGPSFRFLLGFGLILGCLLWMQVNGLITQAKEVKGFSDFFALMEAEGAESLSDKISWLPRFIGMWFDGYSSGLAGLVLILSAFFSHWLGILLLTLAGFVILMGSQFGIPSVANFSSQQISVLVGMIFAFFGIFLGRKRKSKTPAPEPSTQEQK